MERRMLYCEIISFTHIVKNLYIICIVLRIKGAITVVASIAGLNPLPVIYMNSLVKNYLKRFYFAIHLL